STRRRRRSCTRCSGSRHQRSIETAPLQHKTRPALAGLVLSVEFALARGVAAVAATETVPLNLIEVILAKEGSIEKAFASLARHCARRFASRNRGQRLFPGPDTQARHGDGPGLPAC